jgi:hypothetical protein
MSGKLKDLGIPPEARKAANHPISRKTGKSQLGRRGHDPDVALGHAAQGYQGFAVCVTLIYGSSMFDVVPFDEDDTLCQSSFKSHEWHSPSDYTAAGGANGWTCKLCISCERGRVGNGSVSNDSVYF